VIPPGATLGLLGGGQLGRMFTAEAVRMGYQVLVADPDPHAPAAQLAADHLRLGWHDPAIIEIMRQRAAVVTTEFENVPADLLRALSAHLPVRPGADALAICQDRLREKQFLNDCAVATVPWAPIHGPGQFGEAWNAIGARPAILKTARLGYDGKGQVEVPDAAALAAAWDALGRVACVLERRVPLASELSVMVARGPDGHCTTWPVGENVHVRGILHTTVVPAAVSSHLAELARATATRIATALDYVGVLGVECFQTREGGLLVNEIAPRPHNSGHWTLDASATSQFEQQVRAITGMPLGAATLLAPVAMVNILGDAWAGGMPRFDRALAVPGVRLHLYGKKEPRPGRKMGHLTAVADTPAEALEAATRAWAALAP
jgi:5-(carboxyamino)imidazole ribonucleotide synthase